MSQLSMWTRTIILLSVSLWAGRCVESPDDSGTADVTANNDVDGGNNTQPDAGADTAAQLDVDSGVDVDSGGDVEPEVDVDSGGDVEPEVEVDSGVDGTTEDAALDSAGDNPDAGDPSDVADVSLDGGAGLGTPCVADGECASGECVALAGGDFTGLCSVVCGEVDECAEGFDCTLVTFGGADAEGRCLPVDYCADSDGDGFGVGSGCRGVDCNDDDFTVNIDAVEVCDREDNDCDGTVDNNIAGVGEDCSTGLVGVCAPGRTQCVDGEVQCVAFASPVDEVCDGLDNDCDGSADEGVLLEGYRVVDGVCVPVSCAYLPSPANGYVSTPDGVEYTDVATYNCLDGYELTSGSSSRTCDAAGVWSGSAGVCSAVCGDGYCASGESLATCFDDCIVPRGFVRIEPGTFLMGSSSSELGHWDNETQHVVTLTHAFYLQVSEVTTYDYGSFLVPGGCSTSCPADEVSWFDAIFYANARSAAEGLAPCYDGFGHVVGGATVYDCEGYRLPTEAEWEYAARAGTTTATYGGNLTTLDCSDTTLRPIAWFCGDYVTRRQNVGMKRPNAWGLYDMLGNVQEWTHDWYGAYPGDVTDPTGLTSGTYRVLRGGVWFGGPAGARAASRLFDGPYERYGFRLARTAL